MTHIKFSDRDREDEIWAMLPEDRECDFCGSEAISGWWHCSEKRHWLICAVCAKEQLPKLFADAIWLNDQTPITEARRSLEDFERTFWYAIACRIEVARRENDKVST